MDTFTNHQSQINIQKFKNTINQLKLSLRNIQNYKQMAPEILQILLKKVYQDSLHSLSQQLSLLQQQNEDLQLNL